MESTTRDRASSLDHERDRSRPEAMGHPAVVIVAQLMIVLDASIVTIALPSAHTLSDLHGEPPVGHHRVHPGFRRPPAVGRPDR